MNLETNSDVYLLKDLKKVIRHIDHTLQPYQVTRKIKSMTPRNVAIAYINEVIGLTVEDNISKTKRNIENANNLVYTSEKQIFNTVVVEFQQEYSGLPVWLSGVSVSLNSISLSVNCSTISYDYDITSLKVKHKKIDDYVKNINQELLYNLMALGKNLIAVKKGINFDVHLSDLRLTINNIRPMVYKYNLAKRQEYTKRIKDNINRTFLGDIPQLALPIISENIIEDKHYVVFEVMFTITAPWASLNWRALIEPDTNSLLYIRALVAHLEDGYVFDYDPLTLTGDTSITPSSPTAVLNSCRTPRPLPELILSSPQGLIGNYISVQDILSPPIPPPTIVTGNFDFNANTDDFSAVNAYYHSDAVFRMVKEMGFDMAVYFDGTVFPVGVDHRGKSGQVNAKAPGNTLGTGSDGFRFGLVESGQPVGIATCVEIVLHEFGHAILWDNVHSPNLGFVHSAGDSLAAIFCDPRSKAPDRFVTFPWLTLMNPSIDRRHDRDVSTGWAWGGTNDDGGYGSEQILSTSHFRIYRSIGGDHSKLCEREFASRYVLYLILHATGILTPLTNPASPEEWVSNLISSDINTINFEGHPGGTVHKVIRWAFEKQGAYQLPGTPLPIVSEGAPPFRDVYINDGREGEYEFIEDTYNTTDIWNRLNPDRGASHQKPISGQINYAYVIVKNGGTQAVDFVNVRGFHHRACCCNGPCCCESVQDMVWPDDFQPMITNSINVTTPIAPGGYVVVGPFKWKPNFNDCMMMVARTKGDSSNIDVIAPGEIVPVKHLVPFDNNIAIRRLCKKHICY